MGERLAEVSEAIWDVAVARDWRLSVAEQVTLSRRIAALRAVTAANVRACFVDLSGPPRGVVTALVDAVRTVDRRRLR